MGCTSSHGKVAASGDEDSSSGFQRKGLYVAPGVPLIPLSEGAHEDQSMSVDLSSPLRRQYSMKSVSSAAPLNQPQTILETGNGTPPTASPRFSDLEDDNPPPRFAPPSIKAKTLSFATLNVNGDADQNSISARRAPPVGLGSRPPSLRMKDKTVSFGNLSVTGENEDNNLGRGGTSSKINSVKVPSGPLEHRPSWTQKILGIGTPITPKNRKHMGGTGASPSSSASPSQGAHKTGGGLSTPKAAASQAGAVTDNNVKQGSSSTLSTAGSVGTTSTAFFGGGGASSKYSSKGQQPFGVQESIEE